MKSKESRQLANNFAQALYEQDSGSLELQEEIYSVIASINSSINDVNKASLIFESPAISSKEKKEILTKIVSTSSAEVHKSKLLNFLLLLVDKQRFHILPNIQIEYRNIIDTNKGLVHAEVISAKELNVENIEKIRAKLEKNILKENERVNIKNIVEPELIGGIRIQIKDLVYDGSIKSKLDNIRRRIV